MTTHRAPAPVVAARLFHCTPADQMTEATIGVVVECIHLVMTLPPEDRLNAVTAIARMWTDFRAVREQPWVPS